MQRYAVICRDKAEISGHFPSRKALEKERWGAIVTPSLTH
jgi:hypothetical protein